MTFDAGDIEAAVGATKRCLDLCQSHRRQTSFTSSLTSSFNKAMQRTSSFATGSNPQRDGNGKHDKEYNNLTGSMSMSVVLFSLVDLLALPLTPMFAYLSILFPFIFLISRFKLSSLQNLILTPT